MELEICVDSLESAKAAQAGGAHRLELCSALSEGGITPSSGLISSVCESVDIPVFVMVRPRAGDFFYSLQEAELMKRDITAAADLGAKGVVLGVLRKNGEVDIDRTSELVELASPLEVTFHRAIDWTPSLEQALEHVIEAGATRVLTSGGKQTAMQGVENLTHMVERAAGRIGVMVCGRIRKENISEIAKKTKAVEFHAALRKKTRSPVTYENPGLSLGELGIDEFARYAVTAADVRALHQAMLLAQDGVFMKSAPHVS